MKKAKQTLNVTHCEECNGIGTIGTASKIMEMYCDSIFYSPVKAKGCKACNGTGHIVS